MTNTTTLIVGLTIGFALLGLFCMCELIYHGLKGESREWK